MWCYSIYARCWSVTISRVKRFRDFNKNIGLSIFAAGYIVGRVQAVSYSNCCMHKFVTSSRLIKRMLVREPEKRASLAEIVNSSWVRAGDSGKYTCLN
jgi:hypothetical protein